MPGIPSPRQRATKRFMLMPLVDVIFLLLTFFMLSSNISPYSLLNLSKPQLADDAAEAGSRTGTDGPAAVVIAVGRGLVQVDGEAVAMDGLETALSGRAGQSALVLPRSSASVQDLVNVLEVLKKSRFRDVSVRARRPLPGSVP